MNSNNNRNEHVRKRGRPQIRHMMCGFMHCFFCYRTEPIQKIADPKYQVRWTSQRVLSVISQRLLAVT